MSRATYRFRWFRITPDREPDAEPITFKMECSVCEKSSAPGGGSEAAQDWAEEHLKNAPEHLSYREHITRPYRAVPGEWL